jgi:SAM-dependent methyltransferase
MTEDVGMTEDIGTGRVRALSFGAIAENYDRYRPTYPDELVADVVGMLPGRRVVEIGAGTGIATAQFAAYELDITCVEPDPQMAGVLEGKFAGGDRVRAEIATFESWSAARTDEAPRFDGLLCAQAWHWTDPETRWRDAARALGTGGVLALFWNRDGYADPDVLACLIEVYERFGITDRAVLRHTEPIEEGWTDEEIAQAVGFTGHGNRMYHWTKRQGVHDHIARLNTISAHLILPVPVRAALTVALIDEFTSRFGHEIDLAMDTELAYAIRTAEPVAR